MRLHSTDESAELNSLLLSIREIKYNGLAAFLHALAHQLHNSLIL